MNKFSNTIKASFNDSHDIVCNFILTMSSYPYLMAVSVRTENKGTAVVTAEREEISGMS